jgi:hypothetical protein
MSGRPWRRPAPYVCIPNERLEALRDVAPDAMGLDYAAWLYISQHYTDGFLTDAQVRRLPQWTARRQDQLVRAGAWRLVPGGIEVPEYLQYNRTKAAIRRTRVNRSHGKDGQGDDGQEEDDEPLDDWQPVDVEPTLGRQRAASGPTPGPTPGGLERSAPAQTVDKLSDKVHDTLREPPTPAPAASSTAPVTLASRGEVRGAPLSTAVSAWRPGPKDRNDEQKDDGLEPARTHVLETRAGMAFAEEHAFRLSRSHHRPAGAATSARGGSGQGRQQPARSR